ncbi:MAG: hypothetical protein PHQ57_00560 [Candidatus Omnitrophica bacterium]|nr:hypothetical protein [Candidatus Omnitrophota bacterium]
MENWIRRIIITMIKRFADMRYRWSIGIYVGDSPYGFKPPKNIKNPVLTAKDVIDRNAEFVADPFMVNEQGIWYMFFEVMDSSLGKAEIGLATSSDACHWQYRQIVLSEPFHLSYPYVFKWGNEYYMIPESYNANSVKLYKAVDFPFKWAHVVDLLIGTFSDSSVFHYADKWWMFTVDTLEYPSNNDRLKLYYSQDLQGPWLEHVKSPVIKGNSHIARPGGRVSVIGERIIRYAQDDYPRYGLRLYAFEITKLTLTEYEERICPVEPVLQANGRGWSKSGMHNIDAHFLGDSRWIACVDGLRRYIKLKGIAGK